jgi:predicted membrane metal-binding protein
LEGETGEIAVALITGARGGISEELNQATRLSGLAHILSISGLHMVIMAGTVFWLVRAARICSGACAPLSHQEMGCGRGAVARRSPRCARGS